MHCVRHVLYHLSHHASDFGGCCTCRFPASANPAVFAAQQTLVEAWTIVGEVFVDTRFAGHNWDQELAESLNAAYSAESGENAYREISHMLSKLGDPFTRVVPARCSLSRNICAANTNVFPVSLCKLHCLNAHLSESSDGAKRVQ